MLGTIPRPFQTRRDKQFIYIRFKVIFSRLDPPPHMHWLVFIAILAKDLYEV